ncbi:MAG: DUF4080 domain-containing protein [Desulforhopalus sp.]
MIQTNRKIKIVGLNGRYTHSCLALFYVRNELEKNYPEACAEISQFTINDNYYETLLKLTEGDPDYIFFSAAIWNSSLVEKLAADLQLCLSSCRVVIGGPQSGVLGDRLKGGNCTVVIGEIEAMDPEFYQHLKNGKLRDRYYGSFFKMDKRAFSYPYRADDFSSHLKNRHVYYESSKGCPFHCTYCLSSTEKGVYHKDLPTVEEELGQILAHKPKVVRFIDRTFNDIPERALAIWKFLQQKGGETLFHFEMAPDRFTEPMFDFLKTLDHGRFQFEIGIQSTNIESLDAVHRRVDREEAHHTVARLAADTGIHLHVDLILGLPFETADSFRNSFRDVFAMGAHYIQMGLLKILPDTPLCQGAGEYEYLHCKQPPYSILQNRWMDHHTIRELFWFSECVEKFMNNRYFTSLWRYLRNRQEDVFVFFEQLLAVCRDNDFFQLAPTQEFLSRLLVKLVDGREDRDLVYEILRYDWLRCGFRYLPDCLKLTEESEQPEAVRSRLYQSMPMAVDGLFRKNNRNQFFRKSFFLPISQRALYELGLESDSPDACLCVLPVKQNNLYRFQEVVVL